MAHWESLLRARAIETQSYVIAAAQTGHLEFQNYSLALRINPNWYDFDNIVFTGQHNAKRSSYGHSMIVDPWGVVVAQCGEGVGVATAKIDLEYLQKVTLFALINFVQYYKCCLGEDQHACTTAQTARIVWRSQNYA